MALRRNLQLTQDLHQRIEAQRAIRENEVVLPDPREYVKHPRKGGLGLLLMSRFMDEIRYIETGEGSECCMIKRVV